jgi:NAD(P)-dependent dehydrogenase (short-subunit alcohol dehydrogenase family)
MSDPLFSIAGQVVLVSGGSRGIGRGLAEGFAARGARVIITGRDQNTLAESAAAIEEEAAEAGLTTELHRVESEPCDVSDSAAIAETAARVLSRQGRVDTLINVAGVNIRQPAVEFTAEQFDFVLDVNLRGAFQMAQAVGRSMLERGSGCVINIDSLNTQGPLRNVAPYAMSKYGLQGMTRALALEWGAAGVRVNGLAPGFILTDLTRKLWADSRMRDWGVTNTPLGRLGTPADLVGTALFLASPAAAFLTGQTIYVDGGFLAGRIWPIPGDGGQGL